MALTIILFIYSAVATVLILMIKKLLSSKTLTTFDYNNVIQKKTCMLYFDLNGFLMSDRDTSNRGHALSGLQPGDHISSFTAIKDLNTYLKSCIKHRGNITYKFEELTENGIIRRIDLIFSPLICGGRINGVMVFSQEMYSKNREAELLDKARELNDKVNECNNTIAELHDKKVELEDAFKKSSKHHIKLQKAMFRIEQQKNELEEAIEIINKQKEELERVNIEIRKSNQMKETFLANTSHEIRTPLNAIIGFTNLLLDSDLTEVQSRYLNNIKVSGNNLLFIINDILDMSKIEAGKLELESVNFDIRELVRSCVDTVCVKRDNKDINVDVSIGTDVPKLVVGDSHRINQVFTNLLNNSIKFTGEDCRIKFIVKLVRVDNDDVELEFTVSDNGIGIPKDKQVEIFQSFTQANIDTTRKYGGTGLGLSITKQLVEMYGGKISVKSVEGEGATFIFNMILKQSNGDIVLSSNKPSVEISDVELDILLVEDNAINRELACDTLMSWNHNLHIDIATNGSIAVDKVKANMYDLILMDIQMPVMDGNSAAKIIRSLEYPKCDIPIIAMTAHAFKEEQDRCLSNGMNDYIMKPFDPGDLCAKICKYTNIVSKKESEPVSSVQAGEEALFNLGTLIEACSGNKNELQTVMDVYEATVPADIDGLVIAYQSGNSEQVQLKAHSLKTAFSYLGMNNAVDLLDGLSQVMKEPGADLSIPMSDIAEQWNKALPFIKDFIEHYPNNVK